MNDTQSIERLREALGAMAETVRPSPDAYERALHDWRRQERRRRLVGVLVAAVLLAAADVVGLWALNHSAVRAPVVFDAPAPAVVPSSVVPPAPQPRVDR
ncbi:MAG: hypothetical protein ACRCXL_00800 [Dermatophilaceae bacterium]